MFDKREKEVKIEKKTFLMNFGENLVVKYIPLYLVNLRL